MALRDSLVHHAKELGNLFYITNPYDSMYKTVEDIPQPSILERAFPYFFGLLALEHIVLILKGKPGIRVNDGLTSMANGLFMFVKDLALKGALMKLYCHIYEHYRLVDLPWDSALTWILAALVADFCYYWGHRASHELNILWASHQVHHSSEEYNLTTALRQSAMQAFGTMPLYYPAAFFIPPTQMLIHLQFNLLYQFWIHTEAVKTIGPLEHILNTPQHHRVHHGSNRYCLDKNYAGVLIIWDRMFGTFEWERQNEKIVYGLVDQPQFFNTLKHQAFYYGKVFEKASTMDTMEEKISAFVKGPGWFPGTPRLGDLNGVPEIQDRVKYDPKVSIWIQIYGISHFALSLLMVINFGKNYERPLTEVNALIALGFILWTLTSIGWIFDNTRTAWTFEILRCALCLCYIWLENSQRTLGISNDLLRITFMISFFLSAMQFIQLVEKKEKKDN